VVRASLHVCWGQGYPQAYPCSTALLQYNTPRTMHVQFSTHTHTRAHTHAHTQRARIGSVPPMKLRRAKKRCTSAAPWGGAQHGMALRRGVPC
jgi:hypothetical protein